MAISLIKLSLIVMIVQFVKSAPIDSARSKKSISYYYDYVNRNGPNIDDDDDSYAYYEESDLNRSLPRGKKIKNAFDSPIYYIKLPPQPYMYVPGLGYMSQSLQEQQQQHHVKDFVNLAVPFLSNGKPSSIYQWHAASDSSFDETVDETNAMKRKKNSNVHRIPGEFMFNGKPNDIYIFNDDDSYNSLYSDTLQNFYP